MSMEKTVYITEEEREKCRKVIDVFEELYEIEDEDILLVDVGRYGFVKLQCYTASHGFEELDTYTDSNSLFEGLWEECWTFPFSSSSGLLSAKIKPNF